MATCFVIQPFDSGKYDKRYVDVYDPAVRKAGLEPYRVDKDHDVDVPIDAIENGIRNALVCLADITTDNPNVWYELGFAFASGKPVVMVCGEDRTGRKYPFDIQHRTITPYQADSPSDFTTLSSAITPCLFGLYSLIALWFACLPGDPLSRIVVTWPGKKSITFSDAISTVRREVWAIYINQTTILGPAVEKLNRSQRQSLIDLLALAA